MENIKVIAWSLCYIGIVLAVGTIIARINKGSSEISRKFVHIFLGNWVFFTPFFTKLWPLIIVPLVFIPVNILSLKHNIISAMEREDDSLGTVYYPISMLFLSGAGFLLGWQTLPFIGLLTMAYGDGLAAVVGQKWGRIKAFSFAPDKTLEGSMMVLLVSFIVTSVCLYVFQGSGTLREVSLPAIIFIAFLTSIVSTFIELIGEGGCDNLSLPIGSSLFATLALQFGSIGLVIYMLVASIILLAAFKLRSITPDGMLAAFFTALTLYSLGGVWIAVSLLVFFVLGSLISKIKNDYKIKAESLQDDSGARNWKQVLANSLPACIIVWAAYLLPDKNFILLPAFAVFSAAAADTFSSEIGMMTKGRVFNILNGKTMPGGLSGGVSFAGLLAGLVGSLLLSTFALPQFGSRGFIIIAVLGFLGSILDSIIGVLLQSKYLGENGQLQDKKNIRDDKPVKGLKIMSNNAVNFITLSLIMITGQLFMFFIFK
nr:DUF92 domain-containing protein [Tissierella sp.]